MEDVAGYRVLRSAGRGDRALLLLGFDEGRTVVLKITPADDPGTAVEIKALSRAAGDHVVGLDDVATDGAETVLVLERLPNGTLAELLERRSGLDAGEAVTILAPIAATVDRIHALGVAHGGLSLGAICFRDDGAPTLTGFGGAEFFPAETPEVVRETVAGVGADRASLAAIAEVVLGRVVGPGAQGARGLAAGLASTAPGDLADRLFALASATPVRFTDDADVVAVRMGEPQQPEHVDDAPPAGLPAWLTALLPEWLRERLAEPAARVLAVWSAWDPRRRRVVLGAFAGGLGLVGALALVPAAPVASSVAEPTPTPLETSEAEPSLPDDPVEAAVVLLEHRERCLRDLSVLCLDEVVQPDSAAYADDVALIRGVQAGGEYPDAEILVGNPVLVERLGDAALLDLPPGSAPASVLLMRTQNGWRIRQYVNDEYLDAPAVSDDVGVPD
ncbi:protein kinase domain-containing protein [Pseudolysinimonas yzui]|uniref:Protein kinase domain-containing protein n=1 Tax=Pseudolysinimonas yzui TaxID=2708254 RepID=A0A8J3GNS5_9MICO|nr:hypothetical protein [Pseudolysinimonas yzui]GHF08265.1 hypothetical protein GCM10011600_06340 [Pseudolysinimonas yzui]